MDIQQAQEAMAQGKQISIGMCDISVYLEDSNFYDDDELPLYTVTESFPGHVEKYMFIDFTLAFDKFLELRSELIVRISTIDVS
jgi:hypothetical protein